MRASGGRIEHNSDIAEPRHLDEAVHASSRDRHAHPSGTGESVRCRIDPHERTHLERARRAKHFDHQVGADVAAPNDRDLYGHEQTSESAFNAENAEIAENAQSFLFLRKRFSALPLRPLRALR
jgi:hypothetical protein